MEKKQRVISVSVLLMVVIMDIISSLIYVPSLPIITTYFNTSPGKVEMTISFFLLSLSISGLIYGPLSDYYGRKKIIILGLIFFTLGSTMCHFSSSISQLIISRCIQGMGSGVGVVMVYACINDLYSEKEKSKIVAKIGTVIALTPTFAPILGSKIIEYTKDWHTIFIIISTLSTMVLIFVILFFTETKQNTGQTKLSAKKITLKYFAVLKDRNFLSLIKINAMVFFWLWSYNSVLPFILIDHLKLQPQIYGYFAIVSSLFYISGLILNQILLVKFSNKTVVYIGIASALSGCALVILTTLFTKMTPLLTQLTTAPCSIGVAIIYNNNLAKVLNIARVHGGAGSSTVAFIQMVSGALGVSLLGYLNRSNTIPSAIVATILCLVTIITYWRNTSTTSQ